MDRNIKRFSMRAADQYFGVKTRPNHDEDVIVGTQNEDGAESQFRDPPVRQSMPMQPPLPLSVVLVPSDVVWSSVRWEKLNPVYEIGNDSVQPRHGHKAVAFNNLMIVFSGGNEAIFEEEMNVYCTVTNKWFKPRLSGEIPPGKGAYGAAIDGQRLLIFGGMEQEQRFSDTLYECNLHTWECKLLKPCGRTPTEKPDGRFGQSFTEICGRIFMFGGFNDTGDCFKPLNDLHVLHPRLNEQQGLWEKPTTFGNPPSPRESHAAVGYVSKNSGDAKLVIFGGAGSVRLGDIHSLDVNTMTWTEIKANFPPRSLHTASLVGDRVYIFGGWMYKDESQKEHQSKVCDELLCFNVATMAYEVVDYGHDEINENPGTLTLSPIPPARAGHSAVAIGERIYLWSGRNGFQRTDDWRQVCLDDFWMLHVSKAERNPIYVPGIIPQKIATEEGQLLVDLSLVKNERHSPEPPVEEEQAMEIQESGMSASDVFQTIQAFEREVARGTE